MHFADFSMVLVGGRGVCFVSKDGCKRLTEIKNPLELNLRRYQTIRGFLYAFKGKIKGYTPKSQYY